MKQYEDQFSTAGIQKNKKTNIFQFRFSLNLNAEFKLFFISIFIFLTRSKTTEVLYIGQAITPICSGDARYCCPVEIFLFYKDIKCFSQGHNRMV